MDLLDGMLKKNDGSVSLESLLFVVAYSKKKRTEILRNKIAFLQQIANSLCYLHEQKIVYQDLKPENVGVDRQGVVKIFDFRQAKRLAERKADKNGAYELSIAGTFLYMAPKVIRQDRYGLSLDTYSSRVLLWECLYLKREQAKNLNNGGIVFLHKGSSSKSMPPALTDLVTDACLFDLRD